MKKQKPSTLDVDALTEAITDRLRAKFLGRVIDQALIEEITAELEAMEKEADGKAM